MCWPEKLGCYSLLRTGLAMQIAWLVGACRSSVVALGENGRTALHRGHTDCCHLLLGAGSVVDVLNSNNHTPLYLALHNNNDETAKELLTRGAQLGNVKLDEHLTEIPDWCFELVAHRNACREAARAMLELKRRRSHVIVANGKDVLWLLGRLVWASRTNSQWAAAVTSKKDGPL